MSRKADELEAPAPELKNESARLRWEMFHRAIAHAKQSNNDALEETDAGAADSKPAGPFLSIVR